MKKDRIEILMISGVEKLETNKKFVIYRIIKIQIIHFVSPAIGNDKQLNMLLTLQENPHVSIKQIPPQN